MYDKMEGAAPLALVQPPWHRPSRSSLHRPLHRPLVRPLHGPWNRPLAHCIALAPALAQLSPAYPRPSGKGRYVSKETGDVYEGRFVKGVFDGHGKYTTKATGQVRTPACALL